MSGGDLDPKNGTTAGSGARRRCFESGELSRERFRRHCRTCCMHNQRHAEGTRRRIGGHRTHCRVVGLCLAAGMTCRHNRRPALVRHLLAALVFRRSHRVCGQQTGYGRARGPEDHGHQHRKSTCPVHSHSLQLWKSKSKPLPPVYLGAVTKVTCWCAFGTSRIQTKAGG